MFVKLPRSLTLYHNGNIIKIYSDPSGIVFSYLIGISYYISYVIFTSDNNLKYDSRNT